ncbi:SGNH/GDSL hydrolase family protein [Alkalihalobacillus pseudalcaliphilus]|uniref:SGNH/GDSL hydrolase family protein n=1 Tax=Alkalihalobacillus pseudalcaliphilus TaxID=79884 RepID=UPI00064DB948|nr:SGNH/GDSL hydrolase family protein [Alkalihalobacillus pseudalcaliphilus]KMK77397.1 hypothetical protein AB990_02670 [Alkalihalobacillus pseudalcaliphilus]
MKNLLYALLVIGCLAILTLSHLSYHAKLEKIATQSQNEVIKPSSDYEREQNASTTEKNDTNKHDLGGLLGDMINDTNAPLQITFFGSESIYSPEYEGNNWPEILIAKLVEEVDESYIDATIISTGDRSNLEITNENYMTEVIDSKPDLLLFEPFMRSDNGIVAIEDSLEYLTLYLEQIESELPEITVVLMPSNPIYNPQLYLTQITELKSYADTNRYLYADHWQAWPDILSEDIQNYYEGKYTNENGHQVWADYMFTFLTE